MNRPVAYYVVDAFTNRPFAGNPAAVVPLDHWPDDAWLHAVAREMNLSETAYLVPEGAGYRLRWFTPAVEVDLCGHATLAASRALVELGQLADGAEVVFLTRCGELRAARRGARFELDFPLTPAEPIDPPPALVDALRVAPRQVGRSTLNYALVEVADEAAVRAAAPDFGRLRETGFWGAIVTARSDDPAYDFVSRFFAPAMGVNEDPVCGSAHCCLADHWGRRLGKAALVGYQASARGGVVYVERRGPRVTLGGEAVLVARGELLPG